MTMPVGRVQMSNLFHDYAFMRANPQIIEALYRAGIFTPVRLLQAMIDQGMRTDSAAMALGEFLAGEIIDSENDSNDGLHVIAAICGTQVETLAAASVMQVCAA